MATQIYCDTSQAHVIQEKICLSWKVIENLVLCEHIFLETEQEYDMSERYFNLLSLLILESTWVWWYSSTSIHLTYFLTLCPSPICAWGSKSVYSHCSFFSHLSLYPSFPYAICPGLQICLHSSVFSSLHAWRNIPNEYPFLSLISFCVLLKQRERERDPSSYLVYV